MSKKIDIKREQRKVEHTAKFEEIRKLQIYSQIVKINMSVGAEYRGFSWYTRSSSVLIEKIIMSVRRKN